MILLRDKDKEDKETEFTPLTFELTHALLDVEYIANRILEKCGSQLFDEEIKLIAALVLYDLYMRILDVVSKCGREVALSKALREARMLSHVEWRVALRVLGQGIHACLTAFDNILDKVDCAILIRGDSGELVGLLTEKAQSYVDEQENILARLKKKLSKKQEN